MGYIIGSFNLRKLSNTEKKDLNIIAQIIKGENMTIVALQEVFREEAVVMLVNALGRLEWDYAWEKPMHIDSSNATEGYAYVWQKRFLKRVETIDAKNNKRIFKPRINYQYRKFGYSELLRPPYYGRFTPSGLIGGNEMELRLMNVHLRFTGNEEKFNILARKHEFQILTEALLPKIQNKVYGTQYNTYTLIMGDYNLNIPNGINSSPFLNDLVFVSDSNYKQIRVVTKVDQKTTLKADQEQPFENTADRYANNYDHFTFDESMYGKCEIVQCRRVDGEHYTNDNFAEYRRLISDHMPIVIEIDIRGGNS